MVSCKATVITTGNYAFFFLRLLLLENKAVMQRIFKGSLYFSIRCDFWSCNNSAGTTPVEGIGVRLEIEIFRSEDEMS